jgi:signal transduction histidine kinase
MTLQRQRLAESQVLDRSTRRVLHDEVLPRLHAAMLTLSGHPQSHEVIAQLTDVHHQIANLLHAMPATAASAVSRLGLVGALRQTVNNELGSSFDAVAWQVAPDAEQTAQAIAPLNAEVIFYAARETIRNAARYGRNGDASRPLHLTITAARHDQSGSAGLPVLEFVIQDDGVGLPAMPSAETQSGHGLALHSTMMAVIGGTLTVESQPDAYTRVILALPVK